MRYNDYSKVTAKGELGARCALLSSRLEAPIYRPDVIFGIEQAGWPGDWEGRTILALTCQAQVTKREPSYLDEIVLQLKDHCNERGYLGPIYDGKLNEQQLSGHGWLLRGLCEYYLYRKCDYVLPLIDGIVRGLFLPAAGKYASYPVLPKQRDNGGDMSGNTLGFIGDWLISTDTGCAYIGMDGLIQAYAVLSENLPDRDRDEKVNALIDEMTEQFCRIPFVLIKMQTHATLTGVRGLLRRYGQTNDKTLLEEAKRIFDLYESHGMTMTYANKNWFDRPEWTEPCAVIDSYMAASQLYALCDEPKYAELSQLILYNGVFHAQRNNGGFGCDGCAVDGVLTTHCFEAYWCCTMRGGEGLAAAAAYAVTDNGVIVNPISVDTKVNGKRLSIVSGYPYKNKIRIKYEGGGRLYFFVPSWTKSVKCEYVSGCDENYVYIDAPDNVEFTVTYTFNIWNDDDRIYDGPLMLASTEPMKLNDGFDVLKEDGKYTAKGKELSVLTGTYLKNEAQTNSERLYVKLI